MQEKLENVLVVFEDYFQVLHPKSANVCHSRGVAEKVGCIFGLDRLTQEYSIVKDSNADLTVGN